MQMICEAYALMKGLLGLKPAEMSAIFAEWNKGILDSFLDRDHGGHPQAEGPRHRRSRSSTSCSTPPARRAPASGPRPTPSTWACPPRRSPRRSSRGASRRSRRSASPPRRSSRAPARSTAASKKALVAAIHDALYCSKICCYAQGFQLMRAGAEGIRLEAQLRRDRADLAGRLHHPRGVPAEDHRGLRPQARPGEPAPRPLLQQDVQGGPGELAQGDRPRRRVRRARSDLQRRRSPTTTATARRASRRTSSRRQRDYFGAHTYERVDQPRGKFFHLDWPDPKRPQFGV